MIHSLLAAHAKAITEYAFRMIEGWAEAASIDRVVCCHNFRAVEITEYTDLEGAIEKTARYAGHSNIRTKWIYDKQREIDSAEDLARTRL